MSQGGLLHIETSPYVIVRGAVNVIPVSHVPLFLRTIPVRVPRHPIRWEFVMPTRCRHTPYPRNAALTLANECAKVIITLRTPGELLRHTA